MDYDVPVKVEWEENDKDYIPENISIKILNKYTKQEYGEAQLSKDTNWEHAFKNLFERENGHIITYTIQVADAKNCEFEVTGSQELPMKTSDYTLRSISRASDKWLFCP